MKLKKFLTTHWLIFVFIFVLLLRLPSLFEPFTYGDEGVYLTLGQAARRGLVFYRDIHDNKPPMLYLVAALAENFSAYRLIFFAWSFATLFAFYRLSQALFKKNLLAIITTTTAFALLTNLHTFEGNVANAENFMLLPTIAAFYLVFRSKNPSPIIFFVASVFLSLATLFKVPAAFDFAALCFLLLLTLERSNLLPTVRNLFLAIFGFLLPILSTIIFYAFQGALQQYLHAAFFQNIPYLSSWTANQAQAGGLPLALLTRGLMVSFLVILLLLLRKKVSLVAKIVLVWFAFSWFAALLSSRPYPHYLIQLLPALSLSFGLFFSYQKRAAKEKIIPVILLLVFVASFNLFHFWSYKNLPYYSNFYQFALRMKSREEYFADFDGRANDIYQVANYLKTHTLPSEKIFIWGSDPFIYALAQRLPVGRYTASYHIIDFNGYQETLDELEKQKPKYLVIDLEEKRPFPELYPFVEREYIFEEQINDFQIFHRLFNLTMLE